MLSFRVLSVILRAYMTCPNGPGLYSSSLSCRRPDLWAGLSTLAACGWLRDGSFSAFDAVVAALMGSAV